MQVYEQVNGRILWSENESEIICNSCGFKLRKFNDILDKFPDEWFVNNSCGGCGENYVDVNSDEKEIKSLMNHTKIGQNILDVVGRFNGENLEPIYSDITIILSEKENKSGLNSFNAEQLLIYSIINLIDEVNNGGYEQFFRNSSGSMSPIILTSLKSIEAEEYYLITKEALDRFGNIKNWDNDERNNRMNALNFKGVNFDDLDDKFNSIGTDIFSKIITFILKNNLQFMKI